MLQCSQSHPGYVSLKAPSCFFVRGDTDGRMGQWQHAVESGFLGDQFQPLLHLVGLKKDLREGDEPDQMDETFDDSMALTEEIITTSLSTSGVTHEDVSLPLFSMTGRSLTRKQGCVAGTSNQGRPVYRVLGAHGRGHRHTDGRSCARGVPAGLGEGARESDGWDACAAA